MALAGRPEPRDAPGDLWEFATFCALAERYGGHWSRWPEALRHPGGPGVAAARAELAPRIAFHAWLQQQVQEQLGEVRGRPGRSGSGWCTTWPSAATRRAPTAGRCRTCWPAASGSGPRRTRSASRARTGGCRRGVRTGSPPPATPPTATCCGALRAADGLRIDHVAGLWRLWWVPPGETPDRGTYVHYDSEVMLAVLALEAYRAGAW